MNFKVDEPIEIRLMDHKGDLNYVVTGCVMNNRMLAMSITNKSGTAYSASTIQSTKTYPRKAVRGWQVELLEFVEAGLYAVMEVR